MSNSPSPILAPPEWDRILSAALRNNADEIRYLTSKESVSPSHCNGVGQSALHIAMLWGNVEAVRALIDCGADLSAHNRITGATPLHCAVQSGKNPLKNRIKCVEILIEAGGDVWQEDYYGRTPADFVNHAGQHCVSQASNEDERNKEVEELLHLGRIIMTAMSEPTLHCLIDEKNVEALRVYLHEATEQDVAQANKAPRSVKDGMSENKSNPNDIIRVVNRFNRDRGSTPLQHVVALMMDDIWAPRDRHENQIEKRERLKSIVLLLLQAGADLNAMLPYRSEEGDRTATVLHECVQRACNSGPKGDFGVHDLSHVEQCHRDALDIINFLIQDGHADPNRPTNNEGLMVTPLHASIMEAASAGSDELLVERCLDITRLLVSHGAKLTTPGHGKDADVTPNLLHDAARRGKVRILEFLINYQDSIGLDVNQGGRQGLTPLHFAARSGQVDAAKMLLEAGADVFLQDDQGKTPLDAAVANDKNDVIELLRCACKPMTAEAHIVRTRNK